MNHAQFTVRGGKASVQAEASPKENEITLAARAEKLGETAHENLQN